MKSNLEAKIKIYNIPINVNGLEKFSIFFKHVTSLLLFFYAKQTSVLFVCLLASGNPNINQESKKHGNNRIL